MLFERKVALVTSSTSIIYHSQNNLFSLLLGCTLFPLALARDDHERKVWSCLISLPILSPTF